MRAVLLHSDRVSRGNIFKALNVFYRKRHVCVLGFGAFSLQIAVCRTFIHDLYSRNHGYGDRWFST